MYTVEELTRTRGEAAGRPPYDGCMFMAVTPEGSGFLAIPALTVRELREVLIGRHRPHLGPTCRE